MKKLVFFLLFSIFVLNAKEQDRIIVYHDTVNKTLKFCNVDNIKVGDTKVVDLLGCWKIVNENALFEFSDSGICYVTTVLGRRAHLEPHEDYKGLNRAVQGSGADMMKQAMVDVYDHIGLAPLLTVHDESGYNTLDEEVAYEIAQIMEDAIPLQVPNLVEPAIGPNWGAVE